MTCGFATKCPSSRDSTSWQYSPIHSESRHAVSRLCHGRRFAHASTSARRHSRQRLLATIGVGTSSRRRRRAVGERLGAGTIDNFRIRKAATPCVSTRRGLSGGPGAGSGRFSAGSECPSGQETARTRTRGHGRQHGAAWPFRRGLVPTCRLRRRATAAADEPAQLSLLQQLVLVLLDQLPGGLERDEMHRVSPLSLGCYVPACHRARHRAPDTRAVNTPTGLVRVSTPCPRMSGARCRRAQRPCTTTTLRSRSARPATTSYGAASTPPSATAAQAFTVPDHGDRRSRRRRARSTPATAGRSMTRPDGEGSSDPSTRLRVGRSRGLQSKEL